MAFPLTTIHGRVAPGTDPNNPSGAYEAVHKQTPFKILKELKRAVQNYRVNSPFTLGIVQGLAEGSCLITVAHDQARKSPISLDQLIGSGNWGENSRASAYGRSGYRTGEAILHKSLGENRG